MSVGEANPPKRILPRQIFFESTIYVQPTTRMCHLTSTADYIALSAVLSDWNKLKDLRLMRKYFGRDSR